MNKITVTSTPKSSYHTQPKFEKSRRKLFIGHFVPREKPSSMVKCQAFHFHAEF
jgi:hypothetical protein